MEKVSDRVQLLTVPAREQTKKKQAANQVAACRIKCLENPA
jgi:hypothetical protein